MQRRPDGVSITAIYHFVMSALFFLGSLAIVLFAVLPILFAANDPGAIFGLFAVGFGLLIALILAVAYLAVGIGLWQLRDWGRWGAIILAVISLLGFPIWTVIGALIIWYLLQPEAKQAFGAA
ncbi:MAG: hypothetical protein HPY83_02485 [Anaerolineae bacterium]|nr:hypothetical protein [Anaerolineae bacterium]